MWNKHAYAASFPRYFFIFFPSFTFIFEHIICSHTGHRAAVLKLDPELRIFICAILFICEILHFNYIIQFIPVQIGLLDSYWYDNSKRPSWDGQSGTDTCNQLLSEALAYLLIGTEFRATTIHNMITYLKLNWWANWGFWSWIIT